MSIGSVKRVVMKKLSSSNIFDVVVHVKGAGFKRSKAKVGLTLSELNKHVEETFNSVGKSAKELAHAGRIFKVSPHKGNFQLENEFTLEPRLGESSRMVYIVKGVNKQGKLALEGESRGKLYIEILCDNLDPRSFSQILRLGLGVSKLYLYIPTTYSL